MEASVTKAKNPQQAISSERKSIPWYIYSAVIATTCIITGLIWDISWHISIGRDGLFSPPHILMYIGGILAGFGGGYLMIKTTFFGSKEEREASVWFWWFRSPLSALFLVWGALAMMTSAPFDDWWHNAYGLDVKILSPPHAVLALGMVMVQLGGVMQLLTYQNQLQNTGNHSPEMEKKIRFSRILYIYTIGMLLAILFILSTEYLNRNYAHASIFYKIGCVMFPLILVASSKASKLKWPATTAAGFYMGINMFMLWVLPLFPAEPKLGPIINQITHYVPYKFPLLLIVPCFFTDLAFQKIKDKTLNDWWTSLIVGLVFFFSFLITEWFFAEFMFSSYAANWFFAADALGYNWNPDWEHRNSFYPWLEDSTTTLLTGLGIAAIFSVTFSRIGYWWGNWMKKVQR
ncbi:MAG: hypothetical protein KTR26_05685 [Flammeovirgaceae bacterium]|nr:hypothetical protein [Flammeovirgaceae bacterium]